MRERRSIWIAALWGIKGAHHVSDSTGSSLAGLLEADVPDAFDWDPSALADWPNITLTAADFTAVPQAGGA